MIIASIPTTASPSAFTPPPPAPPPSGPDPDGYGQAETAVEDPWTGRRARIEIEIDELLDHPAPPDWRDPAARVVRREQLTETARQASRETVELLVHNRMTTAKGVQVRADDPSVVAGASD